MALRRQGAVQRELLIGWHEVPVAPGHVFYDRLNAALDKAGFDRKVEELCAPHYAGKAGRPSVPPGRYFRMLFVGYFEDLHSERGVAWRCADSLSLRHFLQLGPSEAVPDHSTLSWTRARLPLEVYDAVFALVLGPGGQARAGQGPPGRGGRLDHGGEPAMRSIVRREDGAGLSEAVERCPFWSLAQGKWNLAWMLRCRPMPDGTLCILATAAYPIISSAGARRIRRLSGRC